jgi:hypothetical protein
MRRFLRIASASLVLIGVIAAAVHAAPSTKNYTATVRVTDATAATNALNTFTVTLTNDKKSNQTFGSANVTLPPGFSATAASTDRTGWTATPAGNVVQLRSTSNAVAANDNIVVSVTVDSATMAGCGDAKWGVVIKQSNDFNGTNNLFSMLTVGSDLTPLGSFAFAPITSPAPAPAPAGTVVPQILVNLSEPISITAKDTCGNGDADYSGGALSALTANPPRLVNATFGNISWATNNAGARVGSSSLTPTDVEVQDNLVVTDDATKISATSDPFDVVEKICAVTGTTCEWSNPKGNIKATSTVGTNTSGHVASLGLGFRPLSTNCTVDGTVKSSFGDGIQIVPLNYSDTFTVVLLYAKSLTGNGPANSFSVCKSTDEGVHWTALASCGKVPVAPCAAPQRTSTGALQITLYLNPLDPLSGGFN